MTKEQGAIVRHKKKEQNGKAETIGLLSHEPPKKWPYARCSKMCSPHPLATPPNQGGHPK